MQTFEATILCTGPVDDSILQSPEFAGSKIDVIPLTSISYEIPPHTQAQITGLLHEKATVIFTSNNAVRSVAQYLSSKIPDWTIYCIGNTTYQLSAQYFGKDKIAATGSTASKLAAHILPVINDERIVFFCGNLRRHELPEALRQKRIIVEEIIVYHTAITPVTISEHYDAILYFSPSAATSFFRQNTLPEHTVLFVMGKTTEDTIRQFSKNEVVTAREPDKKELIKSAIRHILDKKTAQAGNNKNI
jgi:uroporphyrinogen-III synthase